jgi:hypothetical protein
LGDAYDNQQQAAFDAIQVLRQRARQAGTLKTTPQQVVTTDSAAQTISLRRRSPHPHEFHPQPLLTANPARIPTPNETAAVASIAPVLHRGG